MNKVVAPEDLEDEVYSLADEFAYNAPLSVRGHKRIINTLVSRRIEGSALTAEDIATMRNDQSEARASRDATEGRVAFAEKRTPVFEGR